MSGTPRVRSGAFPQTPTTIRTNTNTGRAPGPPTPSPTPTPSADDHHHRPKRASSSASSSRPIFASARASSSAAARGSSLRSSLPPPPPPPPPRAAFYGPLIPLDIIDAPTQRFYAVAIYVGLVAWKCYDWVQLLEDNGESFWLFLKWIGLDFVFLFGLPEMRIPWLELSQPVVIFFYVLHVVVDYMLMFNIGLPVHLWLLGFVKVFYDRELSVSEHYVKASSILQNASLISGRQIINILPEGSAILNPDGLPFCIGGGASHTAALPLYFNATIPADVELIRTDLDTNVEETLRLSKSQLREIAKLVKRQEAMASKASSSSSSSLSSSADGTPVPVRYDVPVKKTGAYRLGRVLDEYKLDVQRPSPFSFVVSCPSARVGGSTSSSSSSSAAPWLSSSSSSSSLENIDRCHGDLSDLLLEVDGTPPLKIVYSRTINGKDHSFHFQSLQPDGFVSPLLGTFPARSSPGSPASYEAIDPDYPDRFLAANFPAESDADISWARSRRVTVGLNETMHVGGEWRYSIDEVHDAFGNVAKYSEPLDDHDVRPRPAAKHLVQSFHVRERPRVRLEGCDLRQPLKVARGKSTTLPVRYQIPGVRRPEDGTAHTLTWQFSPIDTLTKSGDHGDAVTTETFTARHADEMPTISAPGLYTLKSVSSNACEGDVQEPASCLLLNPLEPKLAIRSEGIPDSCGGNSVGLRVDLDLVGTPPFLVRYDVSSNGAIRHEKITIPGMRYQLELIPRTAGQHRYIFRSIDDAVYKAQPLTGADMALEQNVKPAARAALDHPTGKVNACLQDAVGVDVVLSGEAPFTLEYMVLHESKRRPFKVENIETHRYRIETPSLTQGGEYTLALTSVYDRSGCRTHLQGTGDELKISVRRQRPRAAFGLIENKRRVFAVENAEVRLPLRLTGEGPWTVAYRKVDGADDAVTTRTLKSGNDVLVVGERGTYEIVDVRDNQCSGLVDEAAARNCYMSHFRSFGIMVQGGRETIIRNSFLGQHITAGASPMEKNFSGVAISLMSNENAVRDVVIFSAAVGISVSGHANIFTGVHCYNKATGFGGVGIKLQLGGLTQTRIIGCYMDYTAIIAEDPVQLDIVNTLFLGDANIVLKASQRKIISGVNIVDNMFSGSRKGVDIVQLVGRFESIDKTVVDKNNALGMRLKSTVARGTVKGNGTTWAIDFNPFLLFPNLVQNVQYSFYTSDALFPRHTLRSVSHNKVVVEADTQVSATVAVQVDQSTNFDGGNGFLSEVLSIRNSHGVM